MFGRCVSATVIVMIAITMTRHASATSLSFDFESGLQGWTLGTVERVSGAPLGGDFAIFGEGMGSEAPIDTGPVMWIELDLSLYSSITFSQFLVSPADPLINFVGLAIRPVPDPGGLFGLDPGISLLVTAQDPSPNPDLRRVDISDFEGLHRVSFLWTAVNLTPYSGFVDDVTFHAVPEPSTASLVLFGLAIVSAGASRPRAA
jgi:hypothetical protein